MADKRKRAGGEAGQAMVEFLLVLPILLIIIMGCIETAWYFTVKYSLTQYAETVGHNVKPPFWLYWSHTVAPRDWTDKSSGRKPPWLTPQEQALWSFDEYDGWYAFSEPLPGKILGENYYRSTYQESETLFMRRLKEAATIIDPDETTHHLSGGWYIKAEARYTPAGGGGAWNSLRTGEKIEYYCADIKVEVDYHYRPLTPLGEWLFCRDGNRYIEMSASGRYVFNQSPHILS